MLHWMKGTPFQLAEDQGRYDSDTFWEQIDHGRQGTVNRRIFTTVPLVLSVDKSSAQECAWCREGRGLRCRCVSHGT